MLHDKQHYEDSGKTLYAEIRDLESYIHDNNYGGEKLSYKAKVLANQLLADMRKHHISLLELIQLI